MSAAGGVRRNAFAAFDIGPKKGVCMQILDRVQIADLIRPDIAAAMIEDAYRAVAAGTANLPPVGYIAFPDVGGDCHVKFGHITGEPLFIVKIATGFAGNAALGLANNSGCSIALDARTGQVIAILADEGIMTDIRTGIGGAIATRLLARPDSRLVGIVGTGEQARQQVRWLRRLWDGPLEFALWGRSPERADDAVRDLGREGIKVSRAEQLELMCRSSDIVITTTASRAPIVQSDWIRPGSHITAVGADAPGKQELATALVARADVIVADLTSQCIDHGEIATAIAAGQLAIGRVTELGNVLAGTSVGRTTPEQITIADLTGLAVQDIAIARSVLATVKAQAC